MILGEIIKLVSRAGDFARLDIASPPPSTGIGNGTWTRVNGVLAELHATVAVYRRLGGPELPASVERLALEHNHIGTQPEQVVGESMSVLAQLRNFAEDFPAPVSRLAMATVGGQTV